MLIEEKSVVASSGTGNVPYGRVTISNRVIVGSTDREFSQSQNLL
jgi:hypothetical protein